MCAAAQALSMSTRYARVWHTGNTKEPLARILHYNPPITPAVMPHLEYKRAQALPGRCRTQPVLSFLISLQLAFGPFRNGGLRVRRHEKAPSRTAGLSHIHIEGARRETKKAPSMDSMRAGSQGFRGTFLNLEH